MEISDPSDVYNINNYVTFDPTPLGKKVLFHYFSAELREFYFNEDGSVSMPLWEMAQVFGPDHMGVGKTQVIKDNTFEIKRLGE